MISKNYLTTRTSGLLINHKLLIRDGAGENPANEVQSHWTSVHDPAVHAPHQLVCGLANLSRLVGTGLVISRYIASSDNETAGDSSLSQNYNSLTVLKSLQ